MSSNKRKGGIVEFLAGKGFYIILILCIAAIGVSGYMLFFSGGDDDTPDNLASINAVDDEALDKIPMPTIPGTTPRPSLDNALTLDDLPVAAVTTIPTAAPAATATSAASPSSKEKAAPSGDPSPSPKAELVFVWPVKGVTTNVFSSDELVFNKTMGDWRVHLGLDVEAALGTQVLAMADGTVRDVYDDVFLGTTVVIEHQDGFVSYYSNLMRKPPVNISQKVTAGQVIGGIGQTAEGERREVNHLHLELRLHGKPVDPLDYLPKDQN